MMIKSYDDLVALNKESVDAAVAAGTSFTKGVETLSKEYVGYAGKTVDSMIEAAKALVACQNPAEAATLQTKLMRDGMEDAVAQSKKMTELTTALLRDTLEPYNAQMKAMMETLVPKAA